mgnify:CR=1 FL=1
MSSIESTFPPLTPHRSPDVVPTRNGPLSTHHAAVEGCITQWENDHALDAAGIAALRARLGESREPPARRFGGEDIDPGDQWGANWLRVNAALADGVLHLQADVQDDLLLPCAADADAVTLAPDVVVLKVEQPEDDGVFEVTQLRARIWWRNEAWTLQVTDPGGGRCIARLSRLPD